MKTLRGVITMVLNYVGVKFDEVYGKVYYFMNDIEGLQVGDLVVVDTQQGYQVATIKAISDTLPVKNVVKWVVQKVDLARHLERVEKQQKIDELKKKMEQRRKQLEEIQIYRLLAQEDESMRELLKELDALEGRNE